MQILLIVLIVFASLDLIGCGLFLVVVWSEHRRVRLIAAKLGEPIVPLPIGQFAVLGFLGLVGLVGIFLLTGLLLDW